MQDEQQSVELYENRCCVCYVPFWQIKGGRLRRTCSAACRQKLYRMRRGEREKKGRKPPKLVRFSIRRPGATCPVCEGPMEQPAHGRKRKTCGQGCRMKLWRQQHPRCLICGRRFKLAQRRKEWKYCSKRCQWRAAKLQQQQRKREKAWAEVAGYRPDWLPRPGSGYREEMIPWEGEEKSAVIREREPEPNYWDRERWGDDPEVDMVEAERRQMAKKAEEVAAQREQERLAEEEARRRAKYWRTLLEGQRGWKDW